MTEDKLKDAVKRVNSTRIAIKAFEGTSEWEIDRINDCIRGLFARSPYKVGQTVRLKMTPEITNENAPGWVWAKHFLIKGAKAEVREVEFYEGKFRYGLLFEKQSWIDDNGKINLTKDKGLFYFSETNLVKK